jgi:hypothetical protein
MPIDAERRHALVALLSLPDSPDLRRGHRRTVEGRPDRFEMVPHLASTFIQAKLLEFRDRDTSAGQVRIQKGPRHDV